MTADEAASVAASRRRVLLVNHTGTLGGAERSLLELCRALRRAEDVELVVATPEGRLDRELRAIDGAVATFPELRLSFSRRPAAFLTGMRSLARSARAFRRIARANRFDVIHANSLRAALLAVVALPLRRPPLILHARDEIPDNVVGRLLAWVMRRTCSGVIAISRWIGSSYAAFERVAVIDNPVDLDRFTLPPEHVPLTPPFTFLLVAQISPWKRQLDAIRATIELRHEGLPVALQLVGSVKFADATTRLDNRAYLEALHAEVTERDATEYVEFLGERDDVDVLMTSAVALLSTSEREPFGRTVAEAISSGLPVVASDDGGPAEIVEDGQTGWIYRAGSTEDLKNAMRQALAGGGRRRTASFEAARSRFDPQAHARAVRTFYAEVSK